MKMVLPVTHQKKGIEFVSWNSSGIMTPILEATMREQGRCYTLVTDLSPSAFRLS